MSCTPVVLVQPQMPFQPKQNRREKGENEEKNKGGNQRERVLLCFWSSSKGKWLADEQRCMHSSELDKKKGVDRKAKGAHRLHLLSVSGVHGPPPRLWVLPLRFQKQT